MNEEEKMERLMKVITKIFTQAYPRKGNIHNALKMMELVAERRCLVLMLDNFQP